jgi:hypothetical protein
MSTDSPSEQPPVEPPVDPPLEQIHLVEGWPSWSPDGRFIYYHRPARDEKDLLYHGQFSIWAYDTQTGHFGFFLGPGMFPKWNPDGTILGFTWGQAVFFYYTSTRTVRRVSHPGVEAYEFNWSPSGNTLILSAYDGRLMDTLGNIYYHLLPWDCSHGGWGGAGDGVWSRNGDKLLVSSHDSLGYSGIIVVDSLGATIDTIIRAISLQDQFSYENWSHDESQIVANFSTEIQGRSHEDWRLYSSDGALISILAESAGMGRWSPSSGLLAFQKYTWMAPSPDSGLMPDYGRVTIWLCNSDGNDMHELLGWPQPAPDPNMFDGGYNWVTDTYGP